MRGVVASGHTEVTAAAARSLREGGNAFDAVVAAGFASAVAEPVLTSLGGGGFLLARPSGGRPVLFDFFTDTPGRGASGAALEPHFVPVTVRFPGSEQVFHVGHGSCAVPGTLQGLLHVQRRLGRLALDAVLAPAVTLARDGVVVNAMQAYFLDLLYPVMTLTPAGRALFEPAGSYLREGDRFQSPQLAAFLETLPRDGGREVYEGALARAVARDMREGEGLLTEADLAAYRVIEREPLAAGYRGARVLTNPPPALGGALLALALELLGAQPLDGLAFGSARHLELLVAVMQEVERRRAEGPPERLDAEARAESARRVRVASGGTTHVSVYDAEGNAASMTSSNGEGSGYVVPETGVMLNNMMGEDDLHPEGFHASPPGERVASMMAPCLLLEGDRLRLVVGSGGSKRIRSALMQVLSGVVDFGLGVRQAVEAPRVHWDGAHVQVEPGLPPDSLRALARRWPLNAWEVLDVYFGGAHAVAPDGAAGGDPRRGGCVAVVD